jgi:hypothetical protein
MLAGGCISFSPITIFPRLRGKVTARQRLDICSNLNEVSE